jgi:hypothetical protein
MRYLCGYARGMTRERASKKNIERCAQKPVKLPNLGVL